MKQIAGINYTEPKVVLLQQSGIGCSEFSARTAYESFDKSENKSVRELNELLNDDIELESTALAYKIKQVNSIKSSKILDSLAWVHHHHSVLELSNLTYLIRGTSRAVLQEHARHRIQSLTVRSTRYTMSPIINAFLADKLTSASLFIPSNWFDSTMESMNLFVTSDPIYNMLQIKDIWCRLNYQYNTLGSDEFIKLAISKDAISNGAIIKPTNQDIFDCLQSSKNKSNVGDSFKHIVNDNWKVDMVVNFNLRILKNYFKLRSSGAAFKQIQWLSEAMKSVTPNKYLDLIVKR